MESIGTGEYIGCVSFNMSFLIDCGNALVSGDVVICEYNGCVVLLSLSVLWFCVECLVYVDMHVFVGVDISEGM